MNQATENMIKQRYHYWLVHRSGLFDRGYYLQSNPEVKHSGMNPLWHYLRHGWQLGCDPSPDFDTAYYL